MGAEEIHISSMVVHARPAGLAAIKRSIAAFPGAEIHAESACGKLVVVVESTGQSGITDTIEQINNLPNVLNTALVFHQIDAPEGHLLDS